MVGVDPETGQAGNAVGKVGVALLGELAPLLGAVHHQPGEVFELLSTELLCAETPQIAADPSARQTACPQMSLAPA
ncbi:hypothetical protein GCM10022631_15580 [Deinococcus rubellus]